MAKHRSRSKSRSNDYEFDAPDFTDLKAWSNQDIGDDRVSNWFEIDLREQSSSNKNVKRIPLNSYDEQEEELSAETEGESTRKHKSEARIHCPSPKKRQKADVETSSHNKSSPRRSPRLFSKPQHFRKHYSPQKKVSNTLVRSVSQQNIAPNKVPVTDLGNSITSITSISGKMKVKTSEQIELEKIDEMKKKVAEIRKRNQESFKSAISTKGIIKANSNHPATMPEGFHFHSDQRVRGLPARVPETKVKDFTSILRSNLSKSSTSMTLTCPQPFKLSRAKTTASLKATEEYHSVAEKVAAFHKKTPERFRSRVGRDKKPVTRSKSPGLTVAKTPKFATRGRTRSVIAVSSQEQEEAEFNEHQKQQFKAHPVNHKILAVANVGVQKVAPKPTTVAQEFHLHQNFRPVAPVEKEEDRQFHANPLNTKMFEGPMGVKAVTQQPLTIPQSPAFALRSRMKQLGSVPASPTSRLVAHKGVPFKPKVEHSHTIPKPFAVEERSKQMLKRKEEKILQVYEEEKKAREFTAQLLPSNEPDSLPQKQIRPPTSPEPFKLEVDYRGQRYQEEIKIKIEEEAKQAKAQAEFKAGSNKVIYKEPFVPEKSSKPLTDVGSFALNSDVRALHREHYNQHLKAREAEVTAMKRDFEERREQEENLAIAKLRHDMVHKAHGIRKYENVQVHPSEKPLTEPQTPNLRTNRITRGRQAFANDD